MIKNIKMKKLLILLTIAIAACNSQVKTEQKGNENANGNTTTTVPLNKGNKWKADEATKKNVAGMVKVVNDSIYADATKRRQLYATLQSKIDTLVSQCRMQGAEHDALHVWLEKVLKDMKEMKKEDNEYREAYAALKRDIESFYGFFE